MTRRRRGNRGFQMLLREIGDGRSEVTTLNWRDSRDAIRGFAGENIEVARCHPPPLSVPPDRTTAR